MKTDELNNVQPGCAPFFPHVNTLPFVSSSTCQDVQDLPIEM